MTWALPKVSPTQDVLDRCGAMPPHIRGAFDAIVLELQRDPASPHVEDLGGGKSLYTHPNPDIEITFMARLEEKCLVLVEVDWSIVPGPTKVFLSYAREDRKWVDHLTKHLAVLKVQIKLWEDSQLKPGADWEAEIRAQMAAARIAILLVSADFMCSGFITEVELPELLERAAEKERTLTWILVSSCVWEEMPYTKKYSALHNPDKALDEYGVPGERNRQLAEIARQFRRLLTA